MTRDEALAFVEQRVEAQNLRNHMVATEAVMLALARRLGENPDRWALAGLVHDCDLGVTEGDPGRHGEVGAQMLRDAGVEEEVCRAVLAHARASNCVPEARMELALCAADQVTGLVVAAALVHPTRSIASVNVKSLRKRMKEKRFAAGVDREAIQLCERLGLPLDDFLALSVEAMTAVAPRLGL